MPAPAASRRRFARRRCLARQAMPRYSAAGIAMTGERHQRMRPAAIFGALAAIDAWRVGREAQSCRAARNHVDLAAEAWHPETVNDVGGLERELDRRGRPECGSRWRSRPASIGVEISDAPPPLLTDDLDAQDVARRASGGLRLHQPTRHSRATQSARSPGKTMPAAMTVLCSARAAHALALTLAWPARARRLRRQDDDAPTANSTQRERALSRPPADLADASTDCTSSAASQQEHQQCGRDQRGRARSHGAASRHERRPGSREIGRHLLDLLVAQQPRDRGHDGACLGAGVISALPEPQSPGHVSAHFVRASRG